MVDERSAKRMAGKRGLLELHGVQDVPEMLDEGVDSVFAGRSRLVRQPVPFEIDGHRPEPAFSESGHIAPEYVDRAAPSVDEHDRRRLRIAALHHSHFQTGAQSRKAHAISRIPGGKHFAGTE